MRGHVEKAGSYLELARQVQIGAASLGEVFAFCSGLYFRGKLAYARRFAVPPEGVNGVQIITPSRGLAAAETLIGTCDLSEFASIAVDNKKPRFIGPLKQSIEALAMVDSSEFILLGSVATGKYTETLLLTLGERLLFPAVAANQALQYCPLTPRAKASRQIENRFRPLDYGSKLVKSGIRPLTLLNNFSRSFSSPLVTSQAAATPSSDPFRYSSKISRALCSRPL